MQTIILDTGPLGLLAMRRGIPESDDCKDWLDHILTRGTRVIIPEIADYELRRELLRLDRSASVARLDRFCSVLEYLPLTTSVMRDAAGLWALARREGRPTADDKALDGDVILAAQARSLGDAETLVATTNVGHLSRYVMAALWRSIAA